MVDTQHDRFFALSLDLLCVVSPAGRFVELNPRWEEVLGSTEEELRAAPVLEWIHEDDRPALVELLARGSDASITVQVATRFRTHEGGWVWLDWRGRREPGTGLLYAVARDVTYTRQLQDSLVEARRHADEARAAKDAFLRRMNHDLRTPLNAIIGYSEMLEEEAREDSLDTYAADLKRIWTAGHQLLGMVNEVLGLARIEAGRLDLQYEDVAIAELIRGAVNAAQPLAKRAGSVIRTPPPEDLDALGPMHTAPARARQIFVSMLAHALTGPDGDTIEVEPVLDGDTLSVTISSGGPPLDEAQIARILTIDGEEPRGGPEAGRRLGLTLAHRFATVLGGLMRIESEEGRTAVVVELPVVGVEPPESMLSTSDRLDALDLSLPLVLVADDEPMTRRLLRRMLEHKGYRVVTASDGEEALELVGRERPDLICLDVMMPRVDGWNALRTLREDPLLADIPVLMVSVVDQERLAAAVGADAFLQKPVERADLLRAVRHHMNPHALSSDDG